MKNELVIDAYIKDLERLVAKQQLEIEELKKTNLYYLNCFERIFSGVYGIGAPLNDSELGFTPEQREYLLQFVADYIPDEDFKND
jgi:hypothetical protein